MPQWGYIPTGYIPRNWGSLGRIEAGFVYWGKAKGNGEMSKHYEFKDQYKQNPFISAGQLCEWMDREDEFQRGLPVHDPRHWKMFRFDRDENGGEWFELFWGGYAYAYELARIKRPEDLLWLLVHIGRKEWKHFSGYRASALIEAVAKRKGWPPFKPVTCATCKIEKGAA